MCHGVGIISNYSQVSPHGGGAKVAPIQLHVFVGLAVIGFVFLNHSGGHWFCNQSLYPKSFRGNPRIVMWVWVEDGAQRNPKW